MESPFSLPNSAVRGLRELSLEHRFHLVHRLGILTDWVFWSFLVDFAFEEGFYSMRRFEHLFGGKSVYEVLWKSVWWAV